MKKTMKLALLMASTLTLSTISFATDVLSYSEDLFNKNMNQNIKSFIPKYGLNKITPAQKVFIEYFGTNQHFQNKQQSALMSRDKSLSTSVDLSNNCLIEDQGNLGACTANASAGALHATQVT